MAKRKKLKKLLKVLGAGAAIAGLGRAFMNRNARASTNADAIKAMTSNAAYSDDTMPSMLTKNMGIKRRRRDSILAKPGINRMDTSEVNPDYQAPDMSGYRNMDMGLEGYYKNGGTVVKTGEKNKKTKKKVGIQIRGFGKARKK